MAGDQAYLKQLNKSALLKLVRQHPHASRADLSTRCGLTKVTVGTLVAELILEGWLLEGKPTASGSGRPSTPLELDTTRLTLLGAEIGVDYLNVLACDLMGNVLERDYQEIEPMEPGPALERLGQMLQELSRRGRLTGRPSLGLGVGVPGPVVEDVLKIAPNLGWSEVAVLEGLRPHLRGTALEGLPLFLENEANAAALGESTFGGLLSSLAYHSLGVGVGCGIVINGQVYQGEGGLAGEIGHTLLVVNGETLEAESLVGQRALSRKLGSVELLHMREISLRLENGNVQVSKMGEALGLLLVNLIHTFSPSRIVLGGPLVSLGNPLLEPAYKILEERTLPGRKTTVLVGEKGVDACAIGAAARVLGG
ncbi:MAG: ROK family protein [Pseudopedobacter sp.]|nr:ROK family protein [Deinococcales bacterium]